MRHTPDAALDIALYHLHVAMTRASRGHFLFPSAGFLIFFTLFLVVRVQRITGFIVTVITCRLPLLQIWR